jgi:GGDEF domain-containing protein/DNA repair protein RadC
MASTKLQDFREQYPQYDDLSDQELADALYTSKYDDMDRADFDSAMGIEAPPPPPPEPTLWERTKARFTGNNDDPLADEKPDPSVDFDLPEDQDKAVPRVQEPMSDWLSNPYGTYYEGQAKAKLDAPRDTGPTKGDQLWAGLDEYLANRDTQTIFTAGEAAKEAYAKARGQYPGMTLDETARMIGPGEGQDRFDKINRARRADAWRKEPQKYPEFEEDYNAIRAESIESREKAIGIMQENIDSAALRRERAAQIKFSESTTEMMEAEDILGAGGALDEWTDDPINIMLEISIRSAPNMLDAIPLAVAGSFAGPAGFAIGLGMGSGMAEYRASYSEYMMKAGVDMTDARSVMNAIDNEDLMAAAHEYSMKRGGAIAVADTITGGIATKTVAPLVKSVLGKELMNLAVQTTAQFAGGMGGEAGAIVLTEGVEGLEEAGGELLAEGIGELGTTIFDVGAATVTGMRAQTAEASAARVEAEAESMLGRTVVDDPAQDDVTEDPQEDSGDIDEETAEENETIIRHADENWRVQVKRRYPNGEVDVVVIDRFGNTTDMSLKPGESFTQAVEISEAARVQGDIDDAQAKAGGLEIDDDPGSFYDNAFDDVAEEAKAQKQAARNRENSIQSGYPTDAELDALTVARARAGVAGDVEAMSALAEQIRVKQNSLLDTGDIRVDPGDRDQAEVQTDEFLAEKKKSDTVTEMQRAMKELREQFPEADFIGPENEQIAEMIEAVEMDGMFNMLTEWFDLTDEEQIAMEAILAGTEVVPGPIEGEVIEGDAIGEFHAFQDDIDNLTAERDQARQEGDENGAAILDIDIEHFRRRQEDLRGAIEAEGVNFDTLGKGGDEAQQITADQEDARTIEGELMPEEFETTSDEEMDELYADDLSFMEEKARELRARIEAQVTADNPEAAAQLEAELIDLLEQIEFRRPDVPSIEGELADPALPAPDNVIQFPEQTPQSIKDMAFIVDGIGNMLNLIDTLDQQGNAIEANKGRAKALEILEKLKTDSQAHRVGHPPDVQAAVNEMLERVDSAELRLRPRQLEEVPKTSKQMVEDLMTRIDPELVPGLLNGIKVIRDDGLLGEFVTYGRNKPYIEREGRDPYADFDRVSNRWSLAPGQAAIVEQRVKDLEVQPDTSGSDDEAVQPIPPTKPPGVIDARLKRQSFRDHLQGMAAELQPGGGSMSTLTREESYPGEREAEGAATGTVITRMPSENPLWFQEMVAIPEQKMSVKQVDAAVNKAITGKKLGVRQARVIQHMLNLISGQREEEVSYAREQLEAARALRQDARAAAGQPTDPQEDQRGELFEEDEYADDMTADSRIIFEMMEEARQLGVDEDVLESLAIRHTENQPFMDALQGEIDEQRHFRSAQEAEAQPGEQPDADAAPAAPDRQPVKRKKLTAIQEHAYGKARDLKSAFTAEEFLALPAISKPGAVSTDGRPTTPGESGTQNVNTLTGLIDKGYVASLDPSRSIFEGRFVALDEFGESVDPMIQEMPKVEEDEVIYMSVPWTMNSRGEGDLYIQRIGKNAGTAYRERQGPNDIAISFDQDQLLPDYMFHLFTFLQPQIAQRARGTAQQAIRMTDIDEVLTTFFLRQAKENEQLELYLEQPADPSQAGAPGMEEAKQAAVTAIENMRATSELGRTVARELAAKRRTSLVGQTANTVEDLATLAQIYRDPRLETLRVFFTDVENKIVGQVGLTSRLPGGAPAIIGDIAPPYFDKISATAKSLGATSFYMQHNHPSGASTPSQSDINVTRSMAQDFKMSPDKLQFRGHVVINHNNWSEIDARGNIKEHQVDLQGVDFKPSGGVAGTKIKSPRDAASIAAQVDITTTDIVLIHVDHKHVVLNVSTMPGIEVGTDRPKTRRQVQKYALSQTGTARIIAVGQDASLLRQLDGLVLDAFQITAQGQVRSMAEALEVQPTGDFIPSERPTRVSPDTSEEFDYLRPWAQQEKSSGMNLGVTRIREPGEPYAAALPPKKLQINIGATSIEVLQNPTPQQFRQLRQGIRMEYQELGYSTTADPLTRSTWDEQGNQFVWPSEDGVHAVVERGLAKHLGVDWESLNQNNEGLETGDLFGQDTASAQAIQDEIARRDAKRNTGQESMETGDPMDMFSDATKQVDIDDLFAQDTEYKVEARRGRYSGDTEDMTRAQRVRAMPMDELTAAVFTDELTGAGNLKAYNAEAKLLPVQAIVDADSLKWINDNLGLDAGDAMLVAIAEALDQADVEVYRIGGDEFIVAGWNEVEVRAALQLSEGILANQSIQSDQGQTKGIQITYGIGRNKQSADLITKAKKAHKERTGQRAPRGEKPPGATLGVVGVKPIDMESGTNYVPMIGKHGQLPITATNNLVLGNGRVVRIPKKPVRREHILAVMRKYFGNRIYEGRVKGKLRLGFYRPGHGEVRLKDANDIEVAAHEIAHFLDDRNAWIKPLYTAYTDEMKGVSYDVTKVFEGFAEFMRLYFTQESAAMERAPGFYDAWRNTLAEPEHKKLMAMVEDVQELMHAWTMQGARARGASKQGSATAPFWEKVMRRFPVPFWQGALDGLRSIKKIEIDLGDIGPDEQVAYEKARIAVGGSAGLIDSAFRFGTPGWREDGQGIEFTGDPLSEIFGKHWGDHDVGMYLLARRAQELSQQGRENLMRPDEIRAWLSMEDEIPELRDIHDAYQEFNDRMLDFYEGSGILKGETRAKMQEMNKNYVPFFRVVESRINGRPARAGGNPFQRLKGGTHNVEVVWDNIIEGVGIGINASLINDAKRSILRKLGGTDRLGAGIRNQQAGLYAAPISADNAARTISGDQVLKASVEAMGWTMSEFRRAKEMPMDETEAAIVMIIEQMEDGLPQFLTLFEFNQDPKGNVDFYMDNGKKFHFEIMDAALMDSLQFMGPKGTNLILQIFGGFSAALRRGVVAWPTFQTKNFVRDSLNAWLLSTKIKVPAARAAAQIFKRMSNDPMFREMIVNGGGFANRSQGFEVARHLISNPTELLTRYDRFMGRFENANRLAEYKVNREKGVGPRRSAFLSRDISTDFAMRGSHAAARVLAVSVPFLNARFQGNYRLKRQGDYKTMAISFAMRGAAMAAAGLALYAINKDDDRYKELPEDIKDLYWVFYYGNGESDYFLIPKPFESGMFFGTIPERMMQLSEDQDGEEFADAMLWIALQAFSADITPQPFQPFVDIQKNKTWTGAPIIPFYLENVEPSEQFTYYTSMTARAAGKALGVSPMKLDHIVRGYLGTFGTYSLAATDAMIRAATDEWMGEYGKQPTRGETWRENIVVKGLVDWAVNEGPPRRTKYVSDLYDMVREAEKVANTMALMQKRQSADAELYITDPENQFYQMLVRAQPNSLGEPPLAKTRSALNEVRQQMDLIRMDKTMTGDEKRIELWNLVRKRNDLAQTVMEAIKRAESQMQEMGTEPQAAAGQVGESVELASGAIPPGFTGQAEPPPEIPPDQYASRAQ